MKKSIIKLPQPDTRGKISLEEALAKRRSVRHYTDEMLTLQQISQLLWAAGGITREKLYRTYPSAGALYPLEIYVAAEKVEGLEPGSYHYIPKGHKLKLEQEGSHLKALSEAAYWQEAIADCAACFIIAAVISRTAKKYGDRAELYIHIEVGHAAQNLLLQATALKLGAVPMGAFHEQKVKKLLGLKGEPFYIIPVGKIQG